MNNHIYLQLISLNKKHNEHYLRRYVKLVSFYKQRNWSYKSGFHEHHIVPELFSGLDTKENLVFITIREHFILHHLLYKAFPNSGMVNAFFMMCNGCKHYYGNKVTSKVYQNAMLEFIERQSETVRKMNLKKVADGTHPWQDKEKQSQRAKKRVEEGNHHFSGPENNRKRLKDRTHPFSGPELQRKRVAEGTHHLLDKEKASQRSKKRVVDGEHNFLKKNLKKIECEHCKKIVNIGNFARWHGDKCKSNPLYKAEIKPKIECPHCNRFFSKNTFTQYHGNKCKLNQSFLST